MILWLLQSVLIGFFLLVGLIATFVCTKNRANKKRMQFYIDQGVYALPGWDKFFLGNVSIIGNYKKQKNEAKADPKLNPVLPIPPWLLDQSTESKAQGSYDYTSHQITALNIGEPHLFVTDPEIIQEMMVSKNA